MTKPVPPRSPNPPGTGDKKPSSGAPGPAGSGTKGGKGSK